MTVKEATYLGIIYATEHRPLLLHVWPCHGKQGHARMYM